MNAAMELQLWKELLVKNERRLPGPGCFPAASDQKDDLDNLATIMASPNNSIAR
jgi:hypothetical protein